MKIILDFNPPPEEYEKVVDFWTTVFEGTLIRWPGVIGHITVENADEAEALTAALLKSHYWVDTQHPDRTRGVLTLKG